MTPSYDVKPGVGVGPFQLGDSLWAVLELLRTRKNEYPRVDVSWDDTLSAAVIHVPFLSLYFPSSPTQHLELIRISSMNISDPKGDQHGTCNLTYDAGRQVLLSKSQKLTRGIIGRVFGPTYAAQGALLEYPGVTFKLDPANSGGPGREDGVTSIDVKAKDDAGNGLSIWKGLKAVRILPGKGAQLDLPSGDVLDIVFSSITSQDVLLDLGPPIRKYWKEDDRMARTWGEQKTHDPEGEAGDGDCFWNYFQHGIDFLVSREGRIKRVVVHSNLPGTPLFERYARCPWTIETAGGSSSMISKTDEIASALLRTGASLDSPSPYTPAPLPSSTPEPPSEGEPSTAGASITAGAGPTSGKKKKKKGAAGSSQPGSALSQSPAVLDVESDMPHSPAPTRAEPKIEIGGAEAKGREGKGMMLDRIGEGGLDGVQGDMVSRLIGFEGLIFEEDVASGAITAVTVYEI